MASTLSITKRTSTRREFLKAGLIGTGGLALYSGEIERHWIDVTHRDVALRGLPPDLEGMRIAQVSDIHMNDFTESFFFRRVIDRINELKPDAVFLTGDFVTSGKWPNTRAHQAAWECANMTKALECRQLYAVLGNHDLAAGAKEIEAALSGNAIQVLKNSYLPIERGTGRLWLAGLDDPLSGHPHLDEAIPKKIRGILSEPVVLLCHGPDYAVDVQAHPAGQAVSLMLSGHTHGGQVRLPLFGPVVLPIMGQKFPEGWFQLGQMRLYVNRGIGTIGVPFRLNCPPEITVFTLHAGR
jgi:Predicted phosphohydrolases